MAGKPRDQQPAGNDGGNADGHVDQEDGLPVESEQMRIDQHATQDRAADRGKARRQTE
ncbi:hypothetical protein D3C86_1969260 [compost metagenome]